MSSIDNARRAAGWKHPNERASCKNCKHGEQTDTGNGFCSPMIRCTRHGFYSKLFAICNDWKDVVGVRA
jgi:hypothetical protein